MYRSTRAVKKTEIAKIAKRIEANESLKQGKMPELVPSWLILRGKGGRLSKVESATEVLI